MHSTTTIALLLSLLAAGALGSSATPDAYKPHHHKKQPSRHLQSGSYSSALADPATAPADEAELNGGAQRTHARDLLIQGRSFNRFDGHESKVFKGPERRIHPNIVVRDLVEDPSFEERTFAQPTTVPRRGAAHHGEISDKYPALKPHNHDEKHKYSGDRHPRDMDYEDQLETRNEIDRGARTGHHGHTQANTGTTAFHGDKNKYIARPIEERDGLEEQTPPVEISPSPSAMEPEATKSTSPTISGANGRHRHSEANHAAKKGKMHRPKVNQRDLSDETAFEERDDTPPTMSQDPAPSAHAHSHGSGNSSKARAGKTHRHGHAKVNADMPHVHGDKNTVDTRSIEEWDDLEERDVLLSGPSGDSAPRRHRTAPGKAGAENDESAQQTGSAGEPTPHGAKSTHSASHHGYKNRHSARAVEWDDLEERTPPSNQPAYTGKLVGGTSGAAYPGGKPLMAGQAAVRSRQPVTGMSLRKTGHQKPAQRHSVEELD
ncbi:hypothetical protein CALCODRAFT_501064 [Calocera cornea HHB12733]|uniref:Pal1-domain-containing protein n=1 Tax=Calocera cornea HHB12733 TaxID=1353952 RepID=A0A165DSW0_9BASI|nr:hypothetical protein CALCODRAFT_501064 [Calocera cornea HHB12733]